MLTLREGGRRPGIVWFLLKCIGKKGGIYTDDVLLLIHTFVMKDPIERASLEIFWDKLDREKHRRLEMGAQPPIQRWRLLGFSSFTGYTAYKEMERRYFESKALRELPLWVSFGFESLHAYTRAREETCIS